MEGNRFNAKAAGVTLTVLLFAVIGAFGPSNKGNNLLTMRWFYLRCSDLMTRLQLTCSYDALH